MREYKRTTRECRFDDLPPQVVQAFRKHTEKNELENLEADILICCETASERLKQGFFGRLLGGSNYAQNTTILLTPERIIWCITDTKGVSSVLSARFSEIEVRDFQSDLIEDSGLDISGFINDSAERGSVFIALGAEEAAEKLRRMAKDACRKAK